jgi:hypothetical protein
MPSEPPNADSLETVLQLLLYGRRTIQLSIEGRLPHDYATIVRLATTQALLRPNTIEVVRRSCSTGKPAVATEVRWTTDVVDFADWQIQSLGLTTNW